LCGSFLPLLERVHADFFAAVDGLVECLGADDAAEDAEDAEDANDGDPDHGDQCRSRKHVSSNPATATDCDAVPSASSCGSSTASNVDVYRGFNLSELTSPLHKDILPHTVNILR
jgi:hypothetical protein